MTILAPPIYMWWYNAVSSDLPLMSSYLGLFDDLHIPTGHIMGWMPDCPNLLLGYSGNFTLEEMTNEVQHACNDPAPQSTPLTSPNTC